jgi:uncharacterized membrane protein
MINRELINRKLDNLDHTLITLQRITKTNEPIETYNSNIQKAHDLVEDIKSMVEREPQSSRETNSASRK